MSTLSLFLLPVDWVLQRTSHRRFPGSSLGIEIFSDLDYAGDVALLAEMLEVLLLALEVLKDEAHFLGLKVDWHKIRIQSTTDPVTLPATVSVSGNSVDIVQSFVYFGSEIHTSGSSEPEV